MHHNVFLAAYYSINALETDGWVAWQEKHPTEPFNYLIAQDSNIRPTSGIIELRNYRFGTQSRFRYP